MVAVLEDGDDVRMAQPADRSRFAVEAGTHRFGIEVDAQHFDGNEAVEGRIPREIERPHAPLAQEVDDLIFADARQRRGHTPTAKSVESRPESMVSVPY